MPRKANSFEKALADAEKRLARALNEQEIAKDTLSDLMVEIPSLRQTIAALQQQLNPSVMPIGVRPSVADVVFENRNIEPIAGLSEDDLLPEPEGTPLVPED